MPHPGEFMTQKVSTCKDEHSSAGTLFERLMATQCQQNSTMQELLQRQQESTLALTLPQPEVPTFGGDPIEYWRFIRAFENLIESKTTSEIARLYYLVQYTSGEVQELVSSCLSMKAEEGYREARSLLKKRYGQSYRIATAYAEKPTKGPPLKAEDGSALRRFSILLTGCRNTLKEIGYLSKVENPDTLRMIVSRLPYGLRLKWRDVADKITEVEQQEITIEDLNDFVTSKARVATHAIFGSVTKEVQDPSRRTKRSRSQKTSFVANAIQQQQTNGNVRNWTPKREAPKCSLCNLNHWLSQCDEFKKMSLSERFKFSKQVCDNCLVPGHPSRSCPKRKASVVIVVVTSTQNTPPFYIPGVTDNLLPLALETIVPAQKSVQAK